MAGGNQIRTRCVISRYGDRLVPTSSSVVYRNLKKSFISRYLNATRSDHGRWARYADGGSNARLVVQYLDIAIL